MLRRLTDVLAALAAINSSSSPEPHKYKQVGEQLVGPPFACVPNNPLCAWSVSLNPYGDILAMGSYNQQTCCGTSSNPGTDEPSPSTSIFSYDGRLYRQHSMNSFPVGSPTLSADGGFLAMASFVEMAYYDPNKNGNYKYYGPVPGGVFHLNSYDNALKLDIYSSSGQQMDMKGGILSANGTILLTTTAWSGAKNQNDQGEHYYYYPVAGIGRFAFDGFAYHQVGNTLTIDAECRHDRLPWRMSGDATFLAVGQCVYKYDGGAYKRVAVPPSWTTTNVYNKVTSTAVSSDGHVFAVGCSGDGNNMGAVWVFRYDGREYQLVGDKVVGTGQGGPPQQGASVALSSDGRYLAVGGTAYNSGAGAVWMFYYDGGAYQQIDGPISASQYGTQQGSSVALSADGNVLAVLGFQSSGVGVAWVFRTDDAPTLR